jgi:hypothetical protein
MLPSALLRWLVHFSPSDFFYKLWQNKFVKVRESSCSPRARDDAPRAERATALNTR